MNNLRKVAVITGGARGIGRAIAVHLGQNNYAVAIVDRDQRQLQETTAELTALDLPVLALEGDVSVEDDTKRMVSEIETCFGRIDVLVNNAGITRDSLCMRMKLSDWQKVIEVDLTGVFLMSREVIRGMMKRRWGRIVNISSIVASTGNPGQINYAAAKAGILGLTRTLARETASRCITVNAIAPGFIETDMTTQLPEDIKKRLLGSIPLKRYGTPDDIAATVLFLVSDNAAYITGQTIQVNGGLFM